MQIEQLSKHGYKISNVLDGDLFKQIDHLVDTFVPTSIRQTLDRPNLPAPLPTSIREVLLLDNGELKNKLDNCFSQILPKLPVPDTIEMWRDYPGYTNELHYDAEIIAAARAEVKLLFEEYTADLDRETLLYVAMD